MKRSLFILFLLLSMLHAEAFHIVGGEITYEYQGADSYIVTLTVYRDCFSTTAFDNPAAIGVFYGDGELYDTYSFWDPFISTVSSEVDFACTDISASACVEKGVYVQAIYLPPSPQGYYIAYQRCCRNTTIQNLINPGDFGATYATFVPPSTMVSGNSSPVFNGLPPVGLCLDLPVTFDHSATDIDGDSLVYEFCTPYHGADDVNPAPNIPSPPPWTNVQWSGGFGVDYQITANPAFTLNTATGLLQGTPTELGQFVIGICVKEYREGVFLSEVRRDFQFNIVPCPTAVLAAFSDLNGGSFCEGNGIEFDNLSANSDNFIWNFGDGLTSIEENPVHLYNEPGEYIVTLISEPGEICSDTASAIYTISPVPDPILMEPVLVCPGNTYDITVEGFLDDVITYDWDINSPNAPGFPNEANLSEVEFSETGNNYINVTVTNEAGCAEEAVLVFDVPPPAYAGIVPITDPCQGLTISFENQSAYYDDLEWDFGDSGLDDVSVYEEPNWTYSSSGTYTVTLSVNASETCDSEATIEIDVNPALDVSFVTPDPQCLQDNLFFFEGIGNYTDNASFTWTFGEESNVADASGENAPPVHFDQEGNYQVVFTVTEGPCEDSSTDLVYVVEELDVDFTTSPQGCAPFDASFVDQTTGGASNDYLWEFGDGTVSYFPGSVSHTYTHAGEYAVSLTVASTFGCLSEETVLLAEALIVAPSPIAYFVMEPPFADINDAEVTVMSEAIGQTNCTYLIEDNAPVDDCDFTMEFLTGGAYDITQVVTNEYGCEDRVTATFSVTGHSFYAPSAITLNQDGLNDFFVPVVTGEIVEYRMQIFDRWGQVIFETNEVGRPWVPGYAHVGMHAYRVTLRDSYSFTKVYEGTFSLIR